MVRRILLFIIALVFCSWGGWSFYRMLFVENEYEFSDWIISIGLQFGTGLLFLAWSLDSKKR
jgi:hypothetical protein